MTELELLRLIDPERFWERVERGPEDTCWRWRGRPNHAGYGRLHLGGRAGAHVMAHRISFFLARELGVSTAAITDIVRGRRWKHLVRPVTAA